MSENKTSRYFKYAIGEIILVVIGILIALQINNWNEERKLREKEIVLLKELKDNLDDTKKAIDSSLIYSKVHLDRNNYLLDVIDTDGPYNTKLDTVFGYFPYWNTPYLTQNAYQNIKAIGVEIIIDKNLRKSVVELHEEVLPRLINDWDRWEWDINQTIVMPFFSKHIRGSIENRYAATPNDFSALKTNDEFLNIISVIYRTRIYGIELMKESIVKIEEVQNQIDEILVND